MDEHIYAWPVYIRVITGRRPPFTVGVLGPCLLNFTRAVEFILTRVNVSS